MNKLTVSSLVAIGTACVGITLAQVGFPMNDPGHAQARGPLSKLSRSNGVLEVSPLGDPTAQLGKGIDAVGMNPIQDVLFGAIVKQQDVYFDKAKGLTQADKTARDKAADLVLVKTNAYIRGMLDAKQQILFDDDVLERKKWPPVGEWKSVYEVKTMVKEILTVSPDQAKLIAAAREKEAKAIQAIEAEMPVIPAGATHVDLNWLARFKVVAGQANKVMMEEVQAALTPAQKGEWTWFLSNLQKDLDLVVNGVVVPH